MANQSLAAAGLQPHPGAPPFLKVRDLRVSFRRGIHTAEVVHGLSFDLHSGGSLGIVGESGSGKTVSVLSMLRLLPTRSATVSGYVGLDGQDLLAMSNSAIRSVRGRRVGVIFQDAQTSLSPVLRIGDQIGSILRTKLGLSRRSARQRSIELLGMVGISKPSERIDDYPHEFSGGMLQRVGIAGALAAEPELLIADEPTTALDVTIQAQVLELIRSLSDELGMALILVSHDLAVIANTVEQVNVMYAGYIVEQAPATSIFQRAAHPYTKALLASMPTAEVQPRSILAALTGVPPDPTALPPGCPFYPRCAFAQDECTDRVPGLDPVRHQPQQLARCILRNSQIAEHE